MSFEDRVYGVLMDAKIIWADGPPFAWFNAKGVDEEDGKSYVYRSYRLVGVSEFDAVRVFQNALTGTDPVLWRVRPEEDTNGRKTHQVGYYFRFVQVPREVFDHILGPDYELKARDEHDVDAATGNCLACGATREAMEDGIAKKCYPRRASTGSGLVIPKFDLPGRVYSEINRLDEPT